MNIFDANTDFLRFKIRNKNVLKLRFKIWGQRMDQNFGPNLSPKKRLGLHSPPSKWPIGVVPARGSPSGGAASAGG